MKLYINGIGIVFSGGCGVKALERSLERGLIRPSSFSLPQRGIQNKKVLRVDPDFISGSVYEKKLRRAHGINRMALIAAEEALKEARLPLTGDEETGVLLATGLGSHNATFSYKDSLLSYGEKEPSPNQFSHSVHNSSMSYLAQNLNLHGPALTVSNFCFSFENALLLAGSWISQKICPRVLVGVSDEFGEVLGYVLNELKVWSEDFIPGEGSVFFLLSGEKDNAYCSLESLFSSSFKSEGALLYSGINPGVFPSEFEERLFKTYGNYFGWTMTQNAFLTALGALMLKKKKKYPEACEQEGQGKPQIFNDGEISICTSHLDASFSYIRLQSISI